MPVTAAAEAEHVGHDFCRPRTGLLNAVQELGDFPGQQVFIDHIQVDADLFGLFDVLGQIVRQAPANVLHVVQDGAQWVVDLVGHAGSQSADGKHLF